LYVIDHGNYSREHGGGQQSGAASLVENVSVTEDLVKR